MPTVTLKLPARYATVRPASLLTCGVEVIIDHLTLSSLADAINAMEHNDTDPGERRMNADQCRDALLRELCLGWDVQEMQEAKIPAVLELADHVATIARERDEARESGKIGSCVWDLIEEASGDPIWSTTCKNEFVFIDGGPEENEMKFCPYCGGIIEITTTEGEKP